jgi:hypothetical protein
MVDCKIHILLSGYLTMPWKMAIEIDGLPMLNNQMVPISSVPVAFHRPWPYFKPGAF